MKRINRYVGSFLLAAATFAIPAAAAPQVRVRIYDPVYRDYHRWDDREDRAYRAYLAERRRDYREYRRIRRPEQREYWRWRHEHRDER